MYFSDKETPEDPVKAAETEIKEIKEILPEMRQKVHYLVSKKSLSPIFFSSIREHVDKFNIENNI